MSKAVSSFHSSRVDFAKESRNVLAVSYCSSSYPISSFAAMRVEIICQVVETRTSWPYIFPCKRIAKFVIKHRVRQDNPQIGEEYICDEHAQKCIDAFGEDSVERIV